MTVRLVNPLIGFAHRCWNRWISSRQVAWHDWWFRLSRDARPQTIATVNVQKFITRYRWCSDFFIKGCRLFLFPAPSHPLPEQELFTVFQKSQALKAPRFQPNLSAVSPWNSVRSKWTGTTTSTTNSRPLLMLLTTFKLLQNFQPSH